MEQESGGVAGSLKVPRQITEKPGLFSDGSNDYGKNRKDGEEMRHTKTTVLVYTQCRSGGNQGQQQISASRQLTEADDFETYQCVEASEQGENPYSGMKPTKRCNLRHATSLSLSFPLDSSRWLTTDVVGYAGYAIDFVDDAQTYVFEKLIRQVRPTRRHEIDRLDGT